MRAHLLYIGVTVLRPVASRSNWTGHALAATHWRRPNITLTNKHCSVRARLLKWNRNNVLYWEKKRLGCCIENSWPSWLVLCRIFCEVHILTQQSTMPVGWWNGEGRGWTLLERHIVFKTGGAAGSYGFCDLSSVKIIWISRLMSDSSQGVPYSGHECIYISLVWFRKDADYAWRNVLLPGEVSSCCTVVFALF